MKYYAAINACGSSSSHGFANTWDVFVFESQKARDNWVDSQNNITAKAILRSEATRIANNWSLTRNESTGPSPFSGEFWGICWVPEADEGVGMAGQLVCCGPDDTSERFNA